MLSKRLAKIFYSFVLLCIFSMYQLKSNLIPATLKKRRIFNEESLTELDQSIAQDTFIEEELQEKLGFGEPSNNFMNEINNDKTGQNKEENIVKKEDPLISLDFEKMQLTTFVDFILGLKEMSYFPTQDISNVETSLSVPHKISLDQAYELFLKVLEKEGFSLVQIGDLSKIVKRDAKYIEPLEPFLGKPSADLPESDKTVRFLTFLKNISVADAEPVLKALLTPGAQLIRLDNFNGLLITDRCLSIKYAMKIINELDGGGFQEVVSMVRLKERNASDVKEFLEQLIKKSGNDNSALARLLNGNTETSLEYFPSSVKIIVEERTNTLILMGSENALRRLEDFIINFLDQSLIHADSPFHIYECKFMDADNLKNILQEVTRAPQDSSASKFGGVRAGMKYFSQVKIESDKLGNKLIVSCADKQDWEILSKILIDLDKPQPQVFVDTLIVEITDTKKRGIAGQLRNRTSGNPISNFNFQTSGVLGTPIIGTTTSTGSGLTPAGTQFVSLITNFISNVGAVEQGTSFLSFGPPDNIWALLKVLNTDVRVSSISRPSITISNRASGTVSVKSVKRIPAEQFVTDTSGAGSFTGYQSAPAETKITYKPQINQDGLINLSVDINVSDFVTDAGNTSDRSLTTNVTLANGQVIVMGGFVKTKITEDASKSPFSGIPILGLFLKRKGRTTEKSYIFFFITASIFKPRKTPGIGLYTKMQLHQARDVVAQCVETKWGKDPVYNFFFNGNKEDYDHKVVDFANARYQPTTVDLDRDPFYRDIFDLKNKDNAVNINNAKEQWKKKPAERIVEKSIAKISEAEIDSQVIRLPLIEKTNQTEQEKILKSQWLKSTSTLINNNLKTAPPMPSLKISSKKLRSKFLEGMGGHEDQAPFEKENNFAQYLQTGKIIKNQSQKNEDEKNNFLNALADQKSINKKPVNFKEHLNANVSEMKNQFLEKALLIDQSSSKKNINHPSFLNYLNNQSNNEAIVNQEEEMGAKSKVFLDALNSSKNTEKVSENILKNQASSKENLLRYLFQNRQGE